MEARNNSQGIWNFTFTLGFLAIFGMMIVILQAAGKLFWPIPTFDFIILVLATYRLIRLLTYDNVTDYIREYFSGFTSGPGKTLWHLLDCPWCSGMWLAMASLLLYFALPLARYLLLVLAIAGVATFVQITIWKIGREEQYLHIKKEKE